MEISFWVYVPFLLALYVITQHLLHKLQNFPPTPFLTLPLIGHIYLLKKPLHKTLENLSNLYGPVFFLRLGSRPVLIVSSASAAEECFTKNDIIFANRPQLLFGKHLGYNYTSIVWGPYGDHWRNLRRVSSIEILSSHRLQKLSEIRVDEVKKQVQTLFQAWSENTYEPLQLKPVFYKLMFNVMTRMMAGKRYFGENASKSSAEAKKFQEMVTETSILAGGSNLGDFMPVLQWFVFNGTEKRFKALHKKRDEIMQKWIEEFRNKISDRSTESKDRPMIEILLSLQQREPETYTDQEIKSLLLSLLQAAVSQSVDTMEWAMSFLVNNPEVLKKAQKEIDNRIGNIRIINEADVDELPYLQCIINETLRKRPVAPFLIPHESSKDCTVAGFRVPIKTTLLVNLSAIQNDPKNWTHPERFMPERFEGLEVDTKNLEYKWMPFGTGRRGCPGKKLAMNVVGLAVGSMIQCFDWDRIGKEKVDMTLRSGLNSPMAQPLMANYHPRPKMVHLLSQI